MPAMSPALNPLESELLAALGDRLRKSRVAKGLSAVEVAKRVGVSRATLRAVESGHPSATMGTYLRVLGVLGLAGDLVLVGTGESGVVPRAKAPLKGKEESEPSIAELGWGADDVRSLAVHREAFRLMQLSQGKLDDGVALLKGSSDPVVLAELLPSVLTGEYDRLLEMTPWATRLRRLSPLGDLVPEERRVELIARELESARRLRRLKPSIDKALKGLAAKGVKAELVGSAAWGGFNPGSDVDVLVIDQAGVSESLILKVVEDQLPGVKVDVLYLDAMAARSRAFILKQRARHGRAHLEGAHP